MTAQDLGTRPDPRHLRGRHAEEAAARWLAAEGHTLLAQNLRLGRLEVDLLSIDPQDGALVLTEVKARRAGRHAPELRVDAAKRRHLVTAARILLARPPFRCRPARFDVMAVTLDAAGRPLDLRHLRAAFDASESRHRRSRIT